MSLPPSIRPMLAKPSPPFDSKRHIFELKWDGTRCMVFVDKNGVRLQNRRLIDTSYRYPEFKNIKGSLKAKSAVLDGELVVLDGGVPKFRLLQQREHIVSLDKINMLSGLIPATYVAFDLLYLNGKSLMAEPLIKRRALLEGLFPIADNVVLSEAFDKGKALFSLAVKKGFEGVMAKEKESPYLPGERSGYWLKVKKAFDLDAVICGYIEGEGSREGLFGSLILGVYEKGSLRYIGRVGTGLDEETIKNIYKKLKPLRQKESPFDEAPHSTRASYWVRPEVVARVKYQEVTHEGLLRVPVFKGLREDKDPRECAWEQLLLINRPSV